MAMELKAMVEKAVDRLMDDPALLKQFKTQPVKTLETVLAVDLPDQMTEQVIKAVQAKLKLEALDDVMDKVDPELVAGALGKLKKLF